jgi:hypothetical protein
MKKVERTKEVGKYGKVMMTEQVQSMVFSDLSSFVFCGLWHFLILLLPLDTVISTHGSQLCLTPSYL